VHGGIRGLLSACLTTFAIAECGVTDVALLSMPGLHWAAVSVVIDLAEGPQCFLATAVPAYCYKSGVLCCHSAAKPRLGVVWVYSCVRLFVCAANGICIGLVESDAAHWPDTRLAAGV
jgi:hypothetical protein